MAVEEYRTGRIRMFAWAVAFLGLSLVGMLLLAAFLFSAVLSLAGIGIPLVLLIAALIRDFTSTHRVWAGRRLGVDIPHPYLPARNRLWPQRAWEILRASATWRDCAWLLVNFLTNLVLLVIPVGLAVFGVVTIVFSTVWAELGVTGNIWLAAVHLTGPLFNWWAIPQALVCFILSWLLLPPLLRARAHVARWLLGPTERVRLALRVEQLAESRADTVDTQASEVRRIERDLHDGAQARLVSLGMSLGMAEEMLEKDPKSAQKLLSEARSSTSQALAELRDLVRGIHPPVLVERGLGGAVEALAVTHQIPITVDVTLPGRLSDPVESAAYFAVAEMLTNTSKHSGASRAWVRINYGQGRLVMVIGDDGRGGAAPHAGSGIRGIERRLGAFDGTISIVSPQGGPTIVTMELPCALSSPKTSPSSEKD